MESEGHLLFDFEIKDTGGLIVLPNWIDHFESEDLIPYTSVFRFMDNKLQARFPQANSE